MKGAKQYWIEKFEEEPKTDSEKLAVAFAGDYVSMILSEESVKSIIKNKIKNMNKELKQGQRVEFHIGDLTGKGKIVGKSLIDLPIIGGTYIIEPDKPIRNESYDYTHFVAQENQLILLDN